MRDIEFRGKRTDNGEWVEGMLLRLNTARLAITDEYLLINGRFVDPKTVGVNGHGTLSFYEVIPETVGQYTGLKDKNGVKIFEEDIVRDYIKSGLYRNPYPILGKIYWDNIEHNSWKIHIFNSFHDSSYTRFLLAGECTWEVISNIHDNPELLIGGKGMKYYCTICRGVIDFGVVKDLSVITEKRCCLCNKQTIVPIPDYETPQQYEKRIGKPVSDDMAVWVKGKKWTICQYGHLHISVKQGFCNIVIADPPVPPPDDWKPEV